MPPWKNIEPRGPLLRPKHAALYLGVSVPSYYRMIHEGAVPPTIRIGAGYAAASGVPLSWLEATVRARAAGVLA